MISSKEDDSLTFFQYVEDYVGLRAYKGSLTQNLDHVWNEKNRINFQEKKDKKRKQEEVIKREEEVVKEGKHLRMGSMSMPAPAENVSPHQHQSCNPGFAVRSQSLNSVGGGEEDGSPTSRRQPPPKPRRDPNTKLSISSEAVDLNPTSCKGEDSDRCDETQGCSEDCRKVPPPKPKRNPNTQLSTSFDESYILNHGSKGSPTLPCSRNGQAPSPPQPQSPQQETDIDEPVYIEMSGNAGQEPAPRTEDDEPGEAVYEEMKYPTLDESDLRWDLLSCRSQSATPCPPELDMHAPLSRCTTPRGTAFCDIPPPFPNLLTHRPPLLVFPPAPAQCSPNSDESPLTPLDASKIPMLDNASYSKSPTSSSLENSGSASTSHLRRAERELTATPTITVSGRSSAPPLTCALYKSSSSAHGYQRSHSACPSPVSMGRCLTPLSLMRSPPFDGPFPGAGLPRSASATPHGKGSPPHHQDAATGGRHHGSMQNVSVTRSRTPTSPLDELTNLFTTGRNMLKKNTSGKKSKEPGESESKGKESKESKREHKERSYHSKESKREKGRSSGGKSHRRNSKDKEPNGIEAVSRRDSKDCGRGSAEQSVRRDSKDRVCNGPELPPRRDSRDRGSSTEAPPRRDSKDRGCSSAEPLPRRDSKERGCSAPELLPWQDNKELLRNGLDVRQDSKEKVCYGTELPPQHDSKDMGRTGLEGRRDSKDGGRRGLESGQEKEKSKHSVEIRRESKERVSNSGDVISRRDCKDRGVLANEALHWYEGKDRSKHSTEMPKAHDTDTRSGSSASASSRRSGRSSMSSNIMLGSSNSEPKTAPKARSSSISVAPSPPVGTSQRQQMPPLPWLFDDNTMLEMIERKQQLCREIRSHQRLPDRSPCKKENLPNMPSWKKTNGAKKYGPPPYPAQTTVLWDTAI